MNLSFAILRRQGERFWLYRQVAIQRSSEALQWTSCVARSKVTVGAKSRWPPVPSAAKITRMDEALAWMQSIPIENYVLRRIVGARCLVHPITDRHLFTWRRLGALLGADHKAIKRWHAQGIAVIVAALNRGQD